nr:DBF4-type zinc finger-containing protein 2 homolog [Aegilops tauschii subsp. strangulata]
MSFAAPRPSLRVRGHLPVPRSPCLPLHATFPRPRPSWPCFARAHACPLLASHHRYCCSPPARAPPPSATITAAPLLPCSAHHSCASPRPCPHAGRGRRSATTPRRRSCCTLLAATRPPAAAGRFCLLHPRRARRLLCAPARNPSCAALGSRPLTSLTCSGRLRLPCRGRGPTRARPGPVARAPPPAPACVVRTPRPLGHAPVRATPAPSAR